MENSTQAIQTFPPAQHRFRWPDAVPCLMLAVLLCTVFAIDPFARHGVVIGKITLLHCISPCCAMLAGAVLLSRHGRARYALRFQTVDVAVLGLAGLLLATYRWRLNAEPVKLLFAGQWLVWWLLLRPFAADRRFRRFAVYALAATGLAEVFVGLGQIYGLLPSLHSQYPLTGTFYNPGPYAGFLAVLLPVILGRMLHLGRLRHTRLIRRTTRLAVARHFLQAAFWSTVAVLPASLNRMAWIAAAVSCAAVWMAECPESGQRIRHFLLQKRMGRLLLQKRQTAGRAVLLLCLILAAAGLYLLKTDSANGRLWMGYVSLRVMARHPSGTGLGGFPAAYAEEQAGFFAVHEASPAIQRVAGNPAYAFNEYLQCGAELGWAGLILMVAGLLLAILKGWKKGRYGWSGSLLALMLFAAASYPLQLPSFWILLAIAGNMAISGNGPSPDRARSALTKWRQREYILRGPSLALLCIYILLLSTACTLLQQGTLQAYRNWAQIARTYPSDNPDAGQAYQTLYARLRHEPAFLFDYAKSLNSQKDYAGADSLLERAARLSSDPMVWDVWGRNAWEQGAHELAEQRLIHASRMVPGRMYPYYLLAKLYADPAYLNLPKMEQAARKVLDMKPKVVSPATREMQEEIADLLRRHDLP